MRARLRLLLEAAGDLVAAGRTLVRAGLVRPVVPRAELLGLALRAPFKSPNLGSAVALHAAMQPGRAAIVDEQGTVSWRRLNDRVRRLANALLTVAEPGDRVAFMLRNGRENVECYAACGLAGMSAVPVNTWSSTDDIRHIVQTQEPKLLIADREFTDAVTGAGAPAIWWVGEDDAYERHLAAAPDKPPPVKGSSHIVTHTSGTTGKPKGAQRQLGGGALGVLVTFLEQVPLRRTDVFFIAPPLFHQFGQAMMAVGLVLGSTLVLRRRFDAEEFLQAAVVNRATAAAVLPVMLQRIAELTGPVPVPRFRLVLSSGSALPPALRDRAEHRIGDVIYDLYGSTEVGWATIASPQDHHRRPGSVGRPGRDTTIVIVDDEGNRLPPGEPGRIFVASGFAFEGYTGVEADQAVIDGAIEIGDVGYLDDDGYLFVTGRSDDMIVSGGENIFPSEVEGALEHHPDIRENAVVGIDDEEFGQVLHAFVVVRDGAALTAGDVKTFVQERLARYKAPKKVTFLDALPRNATGKILKKDLRSGANGS